MPVLVLMPMPMCILCTCVDTVCMHSTFLKCNFASARRHLDALGLIVFSPRNCTVSPLSMGSAARIISLSTIILHVLLGS
ncbi:hypothetical protein BZA05DRAFT_411424, partial [Tricharina praecox]